jgi:uncharacterized membrane protein
LDRQPRLVCIPSADAEFSEHASELLAALSDRRDTEDARETLEHRLRRRFPTAVVRPRDPLAEIGVEAQPVWYVTRHGYRSRLAATVLISAPLEQVFDLYVETARIPEWQTAISVTPLESRPELVGNEYLARYKVLGMPVKGRFRVVDAERPTYFRVEAQGGGIRLWYATTFTAVGPGETRIDVDGDYDVPTLILGRLVDRLFVERAVQRDADYAHANFKALCEAEFRSSTQGEAPAPTLAVG